MTDIKTVNKGKFDVIVVGGGIAGICAAVSASRCGAKTLLIEKLVNLGGLATTGLISWYEPLCDGKGEQMVFGMAEELIKLSVKYCFDNLPEKWGGKGNDPHKTRYATRFSPTVFSLALDEYVMENGVSLRFDTLATYPVMDKNRCTGVICETVGGRELFECGVVIDASGSATVMHRAGVPTEDGENYMSYVAHGYDVDEAKEFIEDGDTCKMRKWISAGSDLFGNGQPDGMKMVSGVTAEDVTDFIITGKKRMFAKMKSKGRNDFDLMTLPYMPQFRKIRRIVGKTDFCAEDGKTFSDSIGNSGDFRPMGIGNHYQIPMGALYNEDFPNMIAAGRIISTPNHDGWEVARVIPTCALTGEAAGKMAALCVKHNCSVDDISDKYYSEFKSL